MRSGNLLFPGMGPCGCLLTGRQSSMHKDSVVGTWKLVSNTAITEKGDVNKAAFGQNPSGLLTYTAEGRMMAIISEDGRKPFSIPDRGAAPAEERAQAYSTFMAYAGRYTSAVTKWCITWKLHHYKTGSIPTKRD